MSSFSRLTELQKTIQNRVFIAEDVSEMIDEYEHCIKVICKRLSRITGWNPINFVLKRSVELSSSRFPELQGIKIICGGVSLGELKNRNLPREKVKEMLQFFTSTFLEFIGLLTGDALTQELIKALEIGD